MTSHELALRIAELALSKKARDVRILGLRNVSDITDYFVVCSGDSDTHIKAIADEIEDSIREEGGGLYRKEGYGNLQWVLLDYFDVVAHIFLPRVREYYSLERLWGDAEIEVIEDVPA